MGPSRHAIPEVSFRERIIVAHVGRRAANLMSEIIFVENPADALSLTDSKRTPPRIISVTASASEALDRIRVQYEPIGRFADLRQLSAADDQFNRDVFEIAVSLETMMKQHVPSLTV